MSREKLSFPPEEVLLDQKDLDALTIYAYDIREDLIKKSDNPQSTEPFKTFGAEYFMENESSDEGLKTARYFDIVSEGLRAGMDVVIMPQSDNFGTNDQHYTVCLTPTRLTKKDTVEPFFRSLSSEAMEILFNGLFQTDPYRQNTQEHARQTNALVTAVLYQEEPRPVILTTTPSKSKALVVTTKIN